MSDTESGSLAHRTVRNVAWLGSGQAIRQVVSLLTMIVLARFLGPSEFGIFAMTIFVNELAQLIVDFGMGSALIQRKDLNEKALSSCFWVNVVVALIAAAVIFALGPFIAGYFQQADLRWLMLATGLNLILSSLCVLPQALLARRLAFREIAVSSLVGSMTGCVAAIGAAYADLGVWALAAQPIAGTFVTMAMLFAYARWTPKLTFSFESIQGLLRFSGFLLASNLISHCTRNLHSLILGPALGVAALGTVNMAMMITWLPIAQFTQTVVKATFPVFARLQDDMDRFREGFYRATRIVALLSFPLMVGIGVLAEVLVKVVFGAKWEPAITLIAIVAAPALVQSVTMLSSTVLMAVGRGDVLVRLAAIALPITAVPLWLARNQTPEIAVITLSAAMLVSSFMALGFSLRAIGGSWRRYAREISVPLTCSAAMGVALWLLSAQLGSLPALIRLVGLSALGAVLYLGAVWVVKRSAIEEVVALVWKRA